MLSEITGFQAIYIYCGKCVLRKGIDGLATLVKEQFRLDPFLQIAAYYGQFCGAKRPRCEAERPGFLLI